MAISAGGIGSGLPIDDIIGQLMAVEQRPLTLLASKEASFQASLSAFGQIKGALSSFQTAVNALKDPEKFAGTKSSVGADAGYTASSDATASAGSYDISVQQLAQGQRVATQAGNGGFVPDEGEGTLTITFGAYQGGDTPEFTPDTERQATLQFAGGTLEDLRDAINDDLALGVKASIIFNGSEQQLVLNGTKEGAESAFSIAGTGSLAGLDFNPADTTASNDTVYSLQNAQGARLTVDGIEVTRNSNAISDVIDGVSLTLTQVTDNSARLLVSDDTAPARSAVDDFVKAWNEVNNTLRSLTEYDADTKTAAVLNGDSTARNIQNQMRSMLGGTFSGTGDLNRLSSLGIRFERDGSLSVESADLNKALNDPEIDVARFFAGSDEHVGFAEQVSARLEGYLGNSVLAGEDGDGLTSTGGGLIDGRIEGINASIAAIDRQRETMLTRLENVEKRYRAQFTALDTMVASMNQTSTYLAQQLANLP